MVKCPFQYVFLIASFVGVILIVNACAQNQEYGLGFLNKTGHSLDEVSVYSDGKLWGFPTPLVVGGKATEDGLTMPIPTNAEVRIIDYGEHKSVMVSIKDVPQKFQEGTIYFVLNQDGTVEVKALKEDDDAGYAQLIKGLRPAGEYRLGFVDKTGHDLEDILVDAGGKKLGSPNLGGGNLPARVKVAYSDPLLPPIPPEAQLQWKQDGAPHTAKVTLTGVPIGFEGIIYFVVKADSTVEAHPIKNGDDQSAFKIVNSP